MTEPYLSEKLNNISGSNIKYLSKWENVLNVNFNSFNDLDNLLNTNYEKAVDFILINNGRPDALVLTYKLYLDDEIYIDTFPGTDTCWENAIYPLYNLQKLKKSSVLRTSMKFDGVLHFEVHGTGQSSKIVNEPNSSVKNTEQIQSFWTTDDVLLKCLNSNSYCQYYERTAKFIWQGKMKTILSILDTCPFPSAAITLINLNKDNTIFVKNPEVIRLLNNPSVELLGEEDAQDSFDVIFYWPFTKNGTLKENIDSDLEKYR